MTSPPLRILLLEDDFAFGEACSAGLPSVMNAEVEHVRWIEDALAALEAERFDVAMIDVWVGEGLALEAVRRAVALGVPLVIISGGETPADLRQAAPRAQTLSKPASLNDLRAAILASLGQGPSLGQGEDASPPGERS